MNIIPECFVDTKVAEIAGQASRKYNHQHGCGGVANTLLKFKEHVCLGIIDEDKNKGPQAKYFSEFLLVRDENHLILKRHKDRKQYLILICPEIERWLMNDAFVAGIDPADEKYNLPRDLQGFASLCKTQDIDRNVGFYRFIKALLSKNAPSIVTLKNWIEYFKKNELDHI